MHAEPRRPSGADNHDTDGDACPGAAHAQWCASTQRLAALADGIEYYRRVREALINAHAQVLIVGWEVHSEIDLLRGDAASRARNEEDWPVRLADLLLALVEARPALQVQLLIWEGASLFGLERQHLPRMKRPWAEHPRINLVWDRDTPKLASQHQKFVVIDDAMAFVGGMDLTKSRWDSHQHARRDPRRRIPGLLPLQGGPYHDAMLALDGEAARVLGEWGRERWLRATGERLPAPTPPAHSAWPADLPVLLRDHDVAMALTQPDFGGRPELRQVQASLIEQIEAARELVFIETQYLAATPLVDALCAALAREPGPEVVLILPWGCPGRLQSISMDPPRDELLERLRAADPGGRLGVYWATLAGGDSEDVHDKAVYIHAKVMIIDDCLLRIGSANFNNRSMGLDTELDVFTCARAAADREAIAGFRRQLLAWLAHVEPQTLAAAEQREGSVTAAIDTLRGGERTLHPFDHRAAEYKHVAPLPLRLADPDHPLSELDADTVMDALNADTALLRPLQAGLSRATGIARRHKGAIAVLALMLALALAWSSTPLQSMLDGDRLRALFDTLRGSRAGLIGVFATFTALAAAGFPVTLLIVVIGASFERLPAIGICLGGVLVAALADYLLGRLAPGALKAVNPRASGGIVERLRGRGVLAVAILRNVPIAPFAVVNAGCGVAGLSWWRYLLGTLIGMAPGIILVAVFGHEIGAMLAEPSPAGVARLAALATLIIGLAVTADHLIRRFGRRLQPASADTGQEPDERQPPE